MIFDSAQHPHTQHTHAELHEHIHRYFLLASAGHRHFNFELQTKKWIRIERTPQKLLSCVWVFFWEHHRNGIFSSKLLEYSITSNTYACSTQTHQSTPGPGKGVNLIHTSQSNDVPATKIRRFEQQQQPRGRPPFNLDNLLPFSFYFSTIGEGEEGEWGTPKTHQHQQHQPHQQERGGFD